MKTAEELFREKLNNEAICLIDDSLFVAPKKKVVANHPYALPTKTFEEVKTEKLNDIHFLTNIPALTRNVNKLWSDPKPNIISSGSMVGIARNNRNYQVTENEVSSQGDTDEHLKDIMELYIEAQRAKFEAAGKLEQFDIAKLSFKAVGNKADRLTEMCRQRGIGVALAKPTPVKTTAGLVDTSNNTNNRRLA